MKGNSGQITIPKGSYATLTYPVLQKKVFEMGTSSTEEVVFKSETFLEDVSSKNIAYVVAKGRDMTYVGHDGQTHVRGYRCSGGRYDHSKRQLRTLPVPAGKSVKKVVQGKTCRFMLTTDGTTYWHG